MAASSQDFVVASDLTGVTSINGAQITNQVNNGTPYTDKGILVTTQDTAALTPDVPDAATTTKWQRYLWRRTPHGSDTDSDVKIYVWNPQATSVATYLKWEEIQINVAARQKVYFISTAGQDPNGNVTAIRPAIAYDANLNYWVKTNATNDDEGWVQMLGA